MISTVKVTVTTVSEVRVEHPDAWDSPTLNKAVGAKLGVLATAWMGGESETTTIDGAETFLGQDGWALDVADDVAEGEAATPDAYIPDPIQLTDADLTPPTVTDGGTLVVE